MHAGADALHLGSRSSAGKHRPLSEVVGSITHALLCMSFPHAEFWRLGPTALVLVQQRAIFQPDPPHHRADHPPELASSRSIQRAGAARGGPQTVAIPRRLDRRSIAVAMSRTRCRDADGRGVRSKLFRDRSGRDIVEIDVLESVARANPVVQRRASAISPRQLSPVRWMPQGVNVHVNS